MDRNGRSNRYLSTILVFGSNLIERIVASYFDGKGSIDFDPAGIRFKLTGAPGTAPLAA